MAYGWQSCDALIDLENTPCLEESLDFERIMDEQTCEHLYMEWGPLAEKGCWLVSRSVGRSVL